MGLGVSGPRVIALWGGIVGNEMIDSLAIESSHSMSKSKGRRASETLAATCSGS